MKEKNLHPETIDSLATVGFYQELLGIAVQTKPEILPIMRDILKAREMKEKNLLQKKGRRMAKMSQKKKAQNAKPKKIKKELKAVMKQDDPPLLKAEKKESKRLTLSSYGKYLDTFYSDLRKIEIDYPELRLTTLINEKSSYTKKSFDRHRLMMFFRKLTVDGFDKHVGLDDFRTMSDLLSSDK